jgi:HD-GYP domain-containing protein (c-di-GMP phosphodiesterase class II)
LHKNGPLNADEWDVVKEHPNYGARILEPLERHYPVVVDIVRSEHERWDGRGYPKGLAGKDIPLGSRIIMIADTYDAVCSTRPYRKAMDKDQALKIIREGAGSQFDPELVPVFEKVLADLPLPRY